MSYVVEINSLKKSFDGGREFILKGIDLNILGDSITVVLGYSGTGKSVLLRHMLGLLKPTSGSIKILGRDIWEMSLDELIQMRTKLGVLFQHAALFDDLTVVDNVCFPLIEHNKKISKNKMYELAYKMLKDPGLDEKHYHKLPGELSGGMRKRAGLARCLVLDPEIMFYDEPTTGLDPILTEMVDDLILNTQKNRKGSTSVVITHDLHAAFRIGDHIVMLDQGKVLLSGQRDDFFNSNIELVQRFIEKGFKKK